MKEHYLNSFIEYLKLLGIDHSNINPRYKSDGKMYFDDPDLNKTLSHFSLIFKSSYTYGLGQGFQEGYNKAKKDTFDLMKVKFVNLVSEIEI